MRRIKLIIQYNGTRFYGFQRQHDLNTIQGNIEEAWYKITTENITLTPAGRTDKGVHAYHQVCHIDTDNNLPLIKYLDGLNHYLPPDIRIMYVAEVTPTFHARFSATMRSYRYIIYNNRQASPFWHNRATHVRPPLNLDHMYAALAHFPLHEGDWASFRSAECQSTTSMVNMQHIALSQLEENLIYMEVTANHFLHNMIRIIAGTLIETGLDKRTVESVATLFTNPDRTAAGFTADPIGLYFMAVTYPEHDILDSVGTMPSSA